MADSTTGFQPSGTYTGDGGDIARLLALIPNVDTQSSSGAIAGGGFLDEMSPVAALQLRVELNAIQAAIGNPGGYRQGAQTMSAGDVTATHTDIVTGLADITLANCVIAIKRAGVNVTRDAVISEPVAGTIRVAAGTNYVMTAGDIISFYAE
jgi:hypothetical protein